MVVIGLIYLLKYDALSLHDMAQCSLELYVKFVLNKMAILPNLKYFVPSFFSAVF